MLLAYLQVQSEGFFSRLNLFSKHTCSQLKIWIIYAGIIYSVCNQLKKVDVRQLHKLKKKIFFKTLLNLYLPLATWWVIFTCEVLCKWCTIRGNISDVLKTVINQNNFSVKCTSTFVIYIFLFFSHHIFDGCTCRYTFFVKLQHS